MKGIKRIVFQKRKVHKAKTGFSMIELLAAIIILGILFMITVSSVNRWIQKSRTANLESQKESLVMAAQSYAQVQTSALPKSIGETTFITAQELKDAHYLQEDIVSSDQKSCMENSVVRVYKYSTTGYRYTAYIYCEGDEVPDTIEGIKPDIDIIFTDSNGSNIKDASRNVATSMVQINLSGGKDSDGSSLGIYGYHYVISVKYESQDDMVEIYNSGSLNANGRENLIVKKSISEYVDVTKITYFLVTVEAYNSDGGYLKKSVNSNYSDTDAPICGKITGQAGENEWDKTLKSRKITVACSDGDGSGCKQDSFTKTFNKEMEYGVITISDNAGNTTNCKVRVHLDWTEPVVTIIAYKRNSDGSKGSRVGSVTANHDNPTVTIKSYIDGYGNDSWLNKEKYPYGILYEMTASDNVLLGVLTYSENEKGLKKGANNVQSLTRKENKNLTKSDNKMTFSLVDEGWRIGKITLMDKASNISTIHIYAPIDRGSPTCVSSGGSSDWRKAALTLTGTCSDSMSGCQKTTITKSFSGNVNTTTATPGDVLDYAGNKTTCPANQTVKIDNTAPTVPTVLLYKWKDNSTRPTGSSGLVGYTANSWSKLKVFTTHGTSTDSGAGGIYYQYKTTGVTANATDAKADYRNIEASGTSTIQWRACDKLGNCSAYSSASTVKVDTNNPTCTTSKSNVNSTGGVTVVVSCSDNTSSVSNCPGTKTGITSNQTYTIKDSAGNTGSCSVKVSTATQRRKKTRSWNTCLTTTTTCVPGTVSKSFSGIRAETKCANYCSPNVCGCSDTGTNKDLTKQYCVCDKYSSCASTKTVCVGGWNSWSNWGSWSTSVSYCNSDSCQTESRTIYY